MAQEMLLRQGAEFAQLRVEIARFRATVEELPLRLERTSRISSQHRRLIRPTPEANGCAARRVAVSLAGSPAVRGKRGRWCRARRSTGYN